ncbi:MAG: hypothetical protein ACKVT1_14210 [Dehalococcoidia bacterium]
MPTAHLLVAVSFVGLAVACGCGSRAEPDPPSVEKLYRRVATEVTRPGYVYHQVQELEIHGEEGDRKGTYEVWVDTSRDRARERRSYETTVRGAREEITVVVAEGRAYSTEYSDSQNYGGRGFDVMDSCHGVSAAVTFLMEGITSRRCIDSGPNLLENGRYGGKAVVVLTRGPRGDYAEWTMRWYFDGSTFLPLAQRTGFVKKSRPPPGKDLGHIVDYNDLFKKVENAVAVQSCNRALDTLEYQG